MNGGGNITEEILGSSGAEKLYSISGIEIYWNHRKELY